MRKGRHAPLALLLLLNQFWPTIDKKRFKKSSNKRSPQNIELYAKWGPTNGANNDANTYQKSMPKLVTNKIIKVIKSNVFLNGKTIQIHCKNNGFEYFTGCVRERKRYQTNINKNTNHTQINEKTMQNSCSKKWCNKYRTSSEVELKKKQQSI